ncbi:MAG: hypothetical protein KJ941_10180, partial [Bacteroidetes bacterium]|nr:hypothetical protein [Bacteroidota bacterium]
MTRCFTLFLFCTILNCFGQKEVSIVFTDNEYKKFKKNLKTSFSDSSEAQVYLKSLQSSARKNGFLLANIDSVQTAYTPWKVYFSVNEKFDNVLLTVSDEDKSFLMKGGFSSERLLFRPSFRPAELNRLMTVWQDKYLNEGFPFAKIELKMDSIRQTVGYARLLVDKGVTVKWLKINIKGDTSVSESFVSSLLQIKKGEIYNEERVLKISEKIRQVAFLEETKVHELLFTQEGVELYLYLKSKPVSSLNGFVGLQPKLPSGYAFAGDIALKLWNVFKKGELFDLNWRNIQGQTQQLKTNLNLPFLFRTPFGLDGSFQLYKRDSSFLDVHSRVAIEYQLGGGSKVFFYYQRSNSSVLKAGQNSTTYTNLANVSSNNYGLGFKFNRLDYLPNPSTGISVDMTGSVGARTSQSFDSTNALRSTQYSGKLEFSYFFPISKRNVIRIGNQSWFLDANPLYQNELYRFGGLLQQRGFNEDE